MGILLYLRASNWRVVSIRYYVVRHLRTDFCGPTFADGHLRIADRHLRTDFCGRTFADCGPSFADRTFADRFKFKKI